MSFPRYEAYKDSGVDWLGEVPEHWNVAPAKWLIRSASGGNSIKGHCADEPIDDLYPGFSASGQDVWLANYDFNIPGIVLSAVGARCGKTFKADGQWGVVANTHCLFPNQESDRNYLWFLTNQEDWWEKGGSAQPFVKVSDTLARKWVFPPLPEQIQIAAFLDRETAKIDSLVAEQRRLMALLKEKRQAVISHAVTRGLNPHVPLKPSGIEWLGDVPAHWEVLSLRRCSTRVQTGGTPSSEPPSTDIDDGFVWFTPGDFGDSLRLTVSDRKISRSVAESGEAKVFPPGSALIVSIGATLGKVGFAESASSGNQQINAVTPNSRVDGYFLTYSLLVKTEVMRFLSNASTIGIMNQEKTKDIWLSVPPRQEQDNITVYLDTESAKFDTLTTEAQRAIDLLQERRTALISAAVTGQIDVRGAVQ